MDKLLSIIIPSYNMERYLPKCLSSIIIDDKELLQKLDVIVVNDGSKDRTSEIAHEYEAKYPGVFRIIDKANGNYGSCINAALPVALGKYVKVLDADDTFETTGFCEFVRFLNETCADVVLTDYNVVDEGGNVTLAQKYPLPIGHEFSVSELTEENCGLLAMHAVAYKLQNILAIGYKQSEGISYTDLEWMFLPMSAMKTASYLPVVVYKYLVGRTGQTCDNAVFIKGVPVNARISLKMLRDYLAQKSEFTEESREYMHTRLLSRLVRIYAYYLLDYVGVRPMKELEDYDRIIKEIDHSIYDEVMSATSSRRFRFAYIRAWRENSLISNIKFILFRAYSKFASSRFINLLR